jgi:hypothetical protein
MNKEKVRDRRIVRSGSRRRPVAGNEAEGSSTTESQVQTAIGNRLRAYYDEVAKQPVPDRFVELLKQLDSKDPTAS